MNRSAETKQRIAQAMLEGKAYAIIDQKVFDTSVTIQEYYGLGYFLKADTIEELANLVGLDPAVLQKTMDEYAEIARKGVDEQFGRPLFPSDLTTAPFYISKNPVQPALHNAVGGIVTNGHGQALREDGSLIPGLYVAGNAADNTLQPNGMSTIPFARVVAQYIVEEN